ncbi:MAG: MFS transporter [Actinomycetota bacterium]|nr:MFS transporter [Actinomycetota bacterium]
MKVRLGVLEEPTFRSLYFARALSLLGDGVVPVALAFAVLSVERSASALGIVLAASAIPRVGLILVGGVVGDRVSRRNVMLATDLVRFGSQATTAFLLISGNARLWHLAVLAFVNGCGTAFFMPASTGLLPQVVGGERLQEANALFSLTASTFMLAGPVLAGILVSTVGAGWAFAVDAATYLGSAAFLTRIRGLGEIEVVAGATFLDQLREGWEVVRSRSWVVVDGVFSALGNAATLAPIFVLGPLVASRSLDGAKSWAIISAGFGLGAIAGGAIALRFKPARPLVVGWTLLALFGVPAALLAVPAPTVAIAGGAFLAGLALNVANTLFETALQQHVPQAALSRASSFSWMLALLLQPIGFALVGPVSDAVGIRATLIGAAVWALLSSCIVLSVPGVRDLRSRDQPRSASTSAAVGSDG